MKVSDLFEHAEFENSQITLNHLYRVQASRTHQFCALLAELTRLYPEKMKFISGHIHIMLELMVSWPSQSITAWALPELCHGSKSGPAIEAWSDKDKQQYDLKYNRMIKAKETFQEAGGKYK